MIMITRILVLMIIWDINRDDNDKDGDGGSEEMKETEVSVGDQSVQCRYDLPG